MSRSSNRPWSSIQAPLARCQNRSGSLAAKDDASVPTMAARTAARTVVALTFGGRWSVQRFGRRLPPGRQSTPALVNSGEERNAHELREGEQRDRQLTTLCPSGPS